MLNSFRVFTTFWDFVSFVDLLVRILERIPAEIIYVLI
jgi:hypothetical protein